MNPEDLIVGEEYVYKKYLRSSGIVFIYVGPDDLGWLFRVKGTRYPNADYRNFSGGIGNLRPRPEPFFEEGKTYVHKTSPSVKRLKIEAVREGPDGLGPAALVLYTVNDSNPFWTVKRPADFASEGGLPLWAEQEEKGS